MERLEGFYKLRIAVDNDESFVEIETLKSITKLNEKTIVNASKKSKKDELIPVDKNGNAYKNTNRKRIPRTLFQTKSAKKWILSKDRKRSKEIIFKDSLYYTEEQKEESSMLKYNNNPLVIIDANNKEELEQILTENRVD